MGDQRRVIGEAARELLAALARFDHRTKAETISPAMRAMLAEMNRPDNLDILRELASWAEE